MYLKEIIAVSSVTHKLTRSILIVSIYMFMFWFLILKCTIRSQFVYVADKFQRLCKGNHIILNVILTHAVCS